jgi:hypothetical protein
MTHDEIMALEGDALDNTVAIAQNWKKISNYANPYWIKSNGTQIFCEKWRPSTNGQQLLELMARELIEVKTCFILSHGWIATKNVLTEDGAHLVRIVTMRGKTINQAVLRCYLASKQGGE